MRLTAKQSDSVTLLAIISALAAGLVAKLWHVEYFSALSTVYVLVFTGFAFRDEGPKANKWKELWGTWLGGTVLYLVAKWIWG